MAKHTDDEPDICVNCQLANVLTEWRDAGGPVEDVISAIVDVVHNIVFAALDEIFEEPEGESKAAH